MYNFLAQKVNKYLFVWFKFKFVHFTMVAWWCDFFFFCNDCAHNVLYFLSQSSSKILIFFANVDVVAVVVIVDVAFCCYAFCTFLKFNVLCKSVQHNNRTVQSSFTIDFTYPLFYSNNILSFIHALNGLDAWFCKIWEEAIH